MEPMNVCRCKLEVAAIRANDFVSMPFYKVLSQALKCVTGIIAVRAFKLQFYGKVGGPSRADD